jgi:hypothetical protein
MLILIDDDDCLVGVLNGHLVKAQSVLVRGFGIIE